MGLLNIYLRRCVSVDWHDNLLISKVIKYLLYVDKIMIGQKTIVLNGIPTSVGEWNRKQDLRGLRG